MPWQLLSFGLPVNAHPSSDTLLTVLSYQSIVKKYEIERLKLSHKTDCEFGKDKSF
jgi:hypothetical protein